MDHLSLVVVKEIYFECRLWLLVSEKAQEVSNLKSFFCLLTSAKNLSAYHSLVDGSVNKTALSNPGPGAYGTPEKNIRYKNSPSWGLGQAKRSDLTDSQLKLVPGPGVYSVPSKVGEGPKY